MKHLLFILIALLSVSVQSAITFDAASTTGGTTQNLTWTHTAAAHSPEAVIVFVTQLRAATGSADEVTGVTYGGISMTEVTGSPLTHLGDATNDSLTQHAFYLREGVPNNTVVSVVVNGSIARSKGAVCYTLQSAGSIAFQDIDVSIEQQTGANPSVNLSLGGNDCFVCIGFGSGPAVVTGITPLTDWTSAMERDHGSSTGGSYYKNSISANDTVGKFTMNTDDAVMIALAIKDSATTSGVFRSYIDASTDDCERSDAIYLDPAGMYMGHNGAQASNIGMRFINVGIPNGSAISSATLTFTCATTASTTTMAIKLDGELANNPATFSTAGDFDARSHTTANTAWVPASWTANTAYVSGDIAAVVQEIVAQGTHAAGEAIVLFGMDNGSTSGATRRAYQIDNGSGQVLLTAAWGPAVGGVGTHNRTRRTANSTRNQR